MSDHKTAGTNGVSVRPDRPSFGASTSVGVSDRADTLLEEYLKWHDLWGHTKKTVENYRENVSPFLRFLKAEGHALKVGEITHRDFDRYLLSVHQRNVSPRYLRTIFSHIKTFFTWLVQEGYLKENPLQHRRPPKVPKTRKRGITLEQVKQLLALPYCRQTTIPGFRRVAIIETLLHCGLRQEELINLRIEDVTGDRRSWVPGTRIRVFGKGQVEKYAPLPKRAGQAIAKYLAYRRTLGEYNPKMVKTEWLWVTETGDRLTYDGIARDMTRLFKHAGLRSEIKDTLHCFRRTFAIESQRRLGRTIAQMGGRWEMATMLDFYVSGELDDEATMLRAYEDIDFLR